MRGKIYATRLAAERALELENERAGVPAVHDHGADGYRISLPGTAAARIHARGVRTDATYGLLAHPDGERFALVGHPEGDDLDDGWVEVPERGEDGFPRAGGG